MIVCAAEGSFQNATLSGYCVGPNKEYEDELESCFIESKKPDMAVWGDWCECVIVAVRKKNPSKLPLIPLDFLEFSNSTQQVNKSTRSSHLDIKES